MKLKKVDWQEVQARARSKRLAKMDRLAESVRLACSVTSPQPKENATRLPQEAFLSQESTVDPISQNDTVESRSGVVNPGNGDNPSKTTGNGPRFNLCSKMEHKNKIRKRKQRIADNQALDKAAGKQVVKKIKRKTLVAKLDNLFSLYIRLRDKLANSGRCAFCPKPAEQCFHFVTRAKHSLRWDERNAIASCAGCNLRYEYDPHFAIQWFIKNWGQPSYDELIFDGNQVAKFSNDDLLEMIDDYKSKLAGEQ